MSRKKPRRGTVRGFADATGVRTADGAMVVEETRFHCPFCLVGRCGAGFTEGYPTVIHTMPTCSRFDALEPDEFMHAVNVALGLHEVN